MEKIIKIDGENITEVNTYLAAGWRVKMISNVVSIDSNTTCYIVLER